MTMVPEALGVYDIVEYYRDGNTAMIRMRCRECGAIKRTKLANKRHFENTKFCRNCPPVVRSRVYGETWQKKRDSEELERLLDEKELKTREEWNDIFRKISGPTTPSG